MKTPYLSEFETSLDAWTDERFVTREELYALAVFNMYLVNLLADQATTYDGHSLNVGTNMCRLVVRGTREGTPQVVFSSGRTPVACVRIFLRKLEEDLLEWSPDRFR